MTEDQRAEWRKALAANAKTTRNRRGRRKRGLATVTSPGMVRLTMARTGDGDGAGHVTGHHGPVTTPATTLDGHPQAADMRQSPPSGRPVILVTLRDPAAWAYTHTVLRSWDYT